VTRTIAIGEPTEEMRDRFTRVLRGHIAIARAVFPDGTTGAQLDSFARQYLWQAGLDFEHVTVHGVGSYLSVHEGPARISKLGTTPLKRGMILSNEPGYYKTDAYGIRIENLELVIGTDISDAEKPVNAFETLTLAPIDRRLIDVAMLSEAELDWLNKYHARVNREVRPHLDDNATKLWLTRQRGLGSHCTIQAKTRHPREKPVPRPTSNPSLEYWVTRIAGDDGVCSRLTWSRLPKSAWPHAETSIFAREAIPLQS
jgi:hypothetical protein